MRSPYKNRMDKISGKWWRFSKPLTRSARGCSDGYRASSVVPYRRPIKKYIWSPRKLARAATEITAGMAKWPRAAAAPAMSKTDSPSKKVPTATAT